MSKRLLTLKTLSISGGELELELNPTNGRWLNLKGGKNRRSWLTQRASDKDNQLPNQKPNKRSPGLPFVAGSGLDNGQLIELSYQRKRIN